MNDINFLMNTTKEKILDVVHKKMCEGFKTNFLTRSKFEKKLSQEKESIIKKFKNFKEEYDNLLNNEDTRSELLNISKEEFILEEFNKIDRWRKYRIDELKQLSISEKDNYKRFEKLYNKYFSKRETIFITSNEYIFSQVEKLGRIENEENNIENHFWKFCINKYYISYNNRSFYEFDFSKEDVYEKIIRKYYDDYVSDENFKLYELTVSNLDDIEFSGFETFVINTGNRNSFGSRSGWITNSFEFINDNKVYNFETSTKDEKQISGKFINLFILQFQKRRLLKLSINLKETDFTPYIIYKDFEKISLKNNCEILITKHHGNEYLIFDTKKQALDFQEKVMEIKAGNNKFQR